MSHCKHVVFKDTRILLTPQNTVINTLRQFHVYCSCRINLTMGKKNRRNQMHNNSIRENATNSNPTTAGVVHDEMRVRPFKKLPQPLAKIPTKINLVVIATGGPGTSRSLLVTTEYQRYMFNCGEGTQRLAAMSRSLRASAYAKLAGLEHVFITHKSWENAGGLLGMAMTLEGQKNPDSKAYLTRDKLHPGRNNPRITIHGPPGVENIAWMAKKFSDHTNLNIVRHDGVFKDAALTVTPIPVCLWAAEEDAAPAPAKRQRRLSGQGEVLVDEAYAYLCQAQPQLPKINVEKCVEAGVTIGPMVGCLQRGESVTLDDGRVVHPNQVTDLVPSDNRPFLVVECPSLDFLPSLRQCSQLQPYLEKSDESLAVIVHMTPADVFKSEGYQSWMSGFHDSTDHMVINRDASEADLIRVRDHQARLNLISQEVFPMLPDFDKCATNVVNPADKPEAALPQKEEGLQTKSSVLNKQGQIVKACPGLLYVYRGKEGLGFQVELDECNSQDIQKSYLLEPEVREQIAALRKVVPATSEESTEGEEENITRYPRVTFLGTGSSEPNMMRAQSCIVVQVSKHSAVVLDCGEDSYGQLYRFFGKTKSSQILCKIKAIFISHLHADHHLGLFSLMKERKIAFDESDKPFVPLLLIAPIQMRRWMRFYHQEMEKVTHLFRFVRHQVELSEFSDGVTMETATFEDVKKELNLTEYKSVEVEHCNNAFGVSFTHANGFKLVYSGDTRPCDSLVAAGEDCDLLIHEATHEDSLLENAKASKHSTFSEAIDVGKKMKAKNTILTHFSQRYTYMVPLFDVDLPQNVGVAFDNMQVTPKTLRYLPHMIPALTSLFFQELQRFESKNIRRVREEAETRSQQSRADSQ
ncbi:unnamed protein product [Candidula unifasciata]|uniref:Zinc phosphodiesterase ELAC protein 2 n=1 Tax=Candidula unifasciata TaxID=100452 RepID=A0A8S3ZTD1_9EUPU|nr:unnamed protein product [Candidula unifasciata]